MVQHSVNLVLHNSWGSHCGRYLTISLQREALCLLFLYMGGCHLEEEEELLDLAHISRDILEVANFRQSIIDIRIALLLYFMQA